jgi:hypothetical protein
MGGGELKRGMLFAAKRVWAVVKLSFSELGAHLAR